MLLGKRSARTSDEHITIYKAMGVAMEDMVAADLAYREPRRLGLGQAISIYVVLTVTGSAGRIGAIMATAR